MKKLHFRIIIFTICVFLVSKLEARKCYICGPNANEPFKIMKDHTNSKIDENFKHEEITIQSCDKFKSKEHYSNDENSEFIIDCPSNFSGCLTFINDTTITRTCEEADVKDCKIVNNIKYCICDFDLCNLNDINLEYENTTTQFIKQTKNHKMKQQRETISVSDIKLYHLLYNTMKPALLSNFSTITPTTTNLTVKPQWAYTINSTNLQNTSSTINNNSSLSRAQKDHNENGNNSISRMNGTFLLNANKPQQENDAVGIHFEKTKLILMVLLNLILITVKKIQL